VRDTKPGERPARIASRLLTFRDFMEAALYDPADGYYPRRSPGEDFYTAPELHPAFAEALADEICERLESLAARRPKAPLFVVEMGSGDGRLARQLLHAFQERHAESCDLIRYVLVERVESLLIESLVRLRAEPGRVLGYSRLADLPPLCGVFISNELVDALPFHVLEKREGRVREVYVEQAEGAWRLQLGDCSSPELARAAEGIAGWLSEGDRHALSLAAGEWMGAVASKLECGALITVDYGDAPVSHRANAPRFFFRHATGGDVLARFGRQDMTASVDFGRLIEEGRRHGLQDVRFCSLGRFLLDRGALERLPAGDSPSAYAERNRLKTLFHPGGMGEAFKVLIQEKRI